MHCMFGTQLKDVFGWLKPAPLIYRVLSVGFCAEFYTAIVLFPVKVFVLYRFPSISITEADSKSRVLQHVLHCTSLGT